MVARSNNRALSSAMAELVGSLPRSGHLVHFTVDDVTLMVRQGILPEDSTTELLNGLIVVKDRADHAGDPMVHGARHRLAIRRLMALAARIESDSRHAQVQLPIICGVDQMPEPDFAVIKGTD